MKFIKIYFYLFLNERSQKKIVHLTKKSQIIKKKHLINKRLALVKMVFDYFFIDAIFTLKIIKTN